MCRETRAISRISTKPLEAMQPEQVKALTPKQLQALTPHKAKILKLDKLISQLSAARQKEVKKLLRR